MTNLLETYKKRIAVSEKLYGKTAGHIGESLSSVKKEALAICLNNISKKMSESFDMGSATQRTDMGAFKRFALNLTTVALPQLIAFDLVYVYPMTSVTGYVDWLEFRAGSNKGATKQGDLLNDPFRLGNVDPTYTSSTVNETHKANATEVAAHAFKVDWTPVVKVEGVKIGTTTYTILETGAPVADTSVLVNADGTITFANADTKFVANADVKVLYQYNNVAIPQNDIPTLKAGMNGVQLLAKARRIAITFSNLAAFQSTTDYGVDLEKELSSKAIGQLNYEIDTEITQLLIDNASSDGDLVWSKSLPIGVNKFDHYEGFAEILEIAKQKVYDRTRRFRPNWMLIASSILPVLNLISKFESAGASNVNGPYYAGQINGLKVYVTPNITAGQFVIGVNGGAPESAAAIYAPLNALKSAI